MDSQTSALITQLRETHDALRSFLTLTAQMEEWKQDLEMRQCLPDLHARREAALEKYLVANGAKVPLIQHDGITLEKIAAVIYLLEEGLTSTVEESLRLLGENKEKHSED